MGGPIPNPFASKPSAPAPVRSTTPFGFEIKETGKTAPTTSEVSQATTTDAAGIKRRRRGRSPTILTGAAGVQEGATLGTPTLLG
jgi:hypothetical protein